MSSENQDEQKEQSGFHHDLLSNGEVLNPHNDLQCSMLMVRKQTLLKTAQTSQQPKAVLSAFAYDPPLLVEQLCCRLLAPDPQTPHLEDGIPRAHHTVQVQVGVWVGRTQRGAQAVAIHIVHVAVAIQVAHGRLEAAIYP